MNDAAVTKLWDFLQSMERRLLVVENKVEFLKGQVKARLKEEADERRRA